MISILDLFFNVVSKWLKTKFFFIEILRLQTHIFKLPIYLCMDVDMSNWTFYAENFDGESNSIFRKLRVGSRLQKYVQFSSNRFQMLVCR